MYIFLHNTYTHTHIDAQQMCKHGIVLFLQVGLRIAHLVEAETCFSCNTVNLYPTSCGRNRYFLLWPS
jgi:hypothetical protein